MLGMWGPGVHLYRKCFTLKSPKADTVHVITDALQPANLSKSWV